ncbi:MAG: hypothetical protein WA581_17135 [Candidatus Acidiferrales bacterium]
MTITKAEAIDVTRFTAQYELLRAQVIGAASDMVRASDTVSPRGIGLALLLREGMPGWLKAVDAVMRSSPALQASNSPRGDGQPTLPHTIAPASLGSAQLHDVITLLASLVLSTRHFAELSPTGRYRSCL